jgi:hypothetical protein
MTDDPKLRPIASSYIRERFGWDRMGDVDWGIVRNNYDSVCRVLRHPEKFPSADFTAIEIAQIELSSFLQMDCPGAFRAA